MPNGYIISIDIVSSLSYAGEVKVVQTKPGPGARKV